METILCPCGASHSITQSTICTCNRRLYTTKELRIKLQELYKQIENLKGQAGSIELELYSRSKQRPVLLHVPTAPPKKRVVITKRQKIKAQAIAALAEVR